MKNIKLILIFLSMIALGFNSLSQTQNEIKEIPKTAKHAIGVAAGLSTGYGLSYQFSPSQKLTFQLAFAPFKDENETQISTGLTFIYRIKEGEKLNFFVYQANHFIVDRHNDYTYEYDINSGQYVSYGPTYVNNDRINNGLGLGFEFFLGKNVLFNLMGGYGARNNFKELGLTGEFGLFYKL